MKLDHLPRCHGDPRLGASQDSKARRSQYGPAYFHGQSSGYPASGYREAHPDWIPWLDFLRLIQPSGVLIDVGCAYGYLVEEARMRAYQSFGFDISDYALTQEPSIHPYLAQADGEAIPLPNACADIVTLFDVLEHLQDPVQCLSESIRILKMDGLIIGATPDPLFFDRKEETHCFERPPSYWIRALEELGLKVQFRFSVEAYNFQFCCAFPHSPIAKKVSVFQHDFLEKKKDFLNIQGPVAAVPRFGWDSLTPRGRSLLKSPASVYLLNSKTHPLRLNISCRFQHSSHFSLLRIRLNSYVLGEIHLTSQQLEHRLNFPEVILPSGGHHLFFDLLPGGPEVTFLQIEISATPASAQNLTLGLPFDLYQRYQLSSEITAILSPVQVLDVGGYLGDKDGHLASSFDFLGAGESAKVTRQIHTTDLRHCDHPDHAPALGWAQPFANQSFDLVISLDVLEHLPVQRRVDLLTELDRLSRHWIILGAPFASHQVKAAEERLAESCPTARRFLQEHQERGLPETSLVEDFFQVQRGYHLFSLSNGYLPRWLEMQVLTQLYFSLNAYTVTRAFNQLYNQNYYPFDQTAPPYRTIFLICKNGLKTEQQNALRKLGSIAPGPPSSFSQSQHPLFFELHRQILQLLEQSQQAFFNVQFLINERQKLIGILERDLESLRNAPLWRVAARRLRKKLKG